LLLQDQDDLPFRKGEVMTVISKDEDQWWTARNSIGQTGSIPVPYITKVSKLRYHMIQTKFSFLEQFSWCLLFKIIAKLELSERLVVKIHFFAIIFANTL